MTAKFVNLGIGGVVLCAVVGLQVYAAWTPLPQPTLSGSLAEHLPGEISGWTVKALPLGETEAVRNQAARSLNFDDFVYHEYSRGPVRFTVYIAYWKPGKMPVRLVNAHSPDRCWTRVGWRCRAMKFEVAPETKRGDLIPGQWRIFAKEDLLQYVFFWHIVGKKAFSYGRFGNRPPWSVALIDLYRNGLNQRREQFFVRLSSNHSFSDLSRYKGFYTVLGHLHDLCLAVEPVVP